MPTVLLRRRQAVPLVVCVLLSALAVRLLLGMLYENHFDIDWYRAWADGLQDGFFDCYARMTEGRHALDYPPLYLICLYAVGKLYALLPTSLYPMWDMLLIKLFPILFDVLLAGLLYICCRRYSEVMAVAVACLWAVSPSAVFNCAAWGQTDGMMAFFLLLALYTVEQDHPVAGSVLYAVACLAKLQCLYFAPVLFCYLWRRHSLQKAAVCVASALGTGIAAFLPFIAGSWHLRGWSALLTPFEVYCGGLGKYPYAALNTYNLWGLFNLNWVRDSRSLIGGVWDKELGYAVGGFTISHLSLILTAAVLGLTVYAMLKGRREVSLWMGCILLMQGIFCLTARQHERYQLIVLPLLLIAFVRLCNWRLLWLYLSLTVVTFLNQMMLLFRNNTFYEPAAPWAAIFATVQTIMSAVNLLLFAWSVWEVCRFAFAKTYPMPVNSAPAQKEDTP